VNCGKKLLMLKNYCMGKLKDWFNRPIKKSTFYVTNGLIFALALAYMAFRADSSLSVNELYCGVVSENQHVLVNEVGMQKEILHKVCGYVNSDDPVCKGDTVTIVSFHGGLDSEFRCYLGQPNKELMSLMMQNALTEVYRLFGFVGGGYVLMFLIMSFIELSMERKNKE